MQNVTRKTAQRLGHGKASLPHLLELPHDFSWVLLDKCLEDTEHVIREDQLMSKFVEQARHAIRMRSPSLYHSLDTDWSLQCINSLGRGLRHESVGAVRLVASLMQKSPDLELISAKERRSQCLLNVVKVDDELSRFDPDDQVIRRMRLELLLLLGEAPDLEKVMLNAKHGPGTSMFGEHTESSAYFKYVRWPYLVGSEAKTLLQTAIESDARWLGALEDDYRRRYRIPYTAVLNRSVFFENVMFPVTFNKISVVPKDGRKDRPIAIEPIGSMYLQLGVDRVLRDKLLTWGMDLNSAVPNREAARVGSLVINQESPATLDLSNASDTVSKFLIEELFPEQWAKLLCSLRCPFGLLPCGTAIVYKKIASMGNGYTFALESLVFLALLRAVSACFGHPSDRLLAYGDDLSYPAYLHMHVSFYLGHIGCKVNMKKTFASGPVRESCGEDYYDGVNIRPVYCRSITDICDLVSIRNKLCRWRWSMTGDFCMPATEKYLFRFYAGEVYIGPETDQGDSLWIIDPQCNPPHLAKIPCLVRRQTDRAKGKQFLLGRLMHDLKDCGSENPRFDISVRGRGTVGRSAVVHLKR